MTPTHHWKFFIDTGGTFTDCLSVDPDGCVHREKVLSSGKLRATIKKIISENTFEISLHMASQEDLFNGYTCDFVFSNRRCQVLFSSGHKITVDQNLAVSEGDYVELTAFEQAPVLVMRLVTQTPLNEQLPEVELRLATTKGTNALLERKGAPVAFFVTKGFRDLLAIGTQQRQDLFALNVIKPPALTDIIIEVDERLDSQGNVLQALDVSQLDELIDKCRRESIEVAAICLVNSYVNDAHEQELENYLREKGFAFVSRSSDLSNAIHYLRRAQTTLINATLSPVISRYLGDIKELICTDQFYVMSSAGSLMRHDHYLPKDSLLSGPAGGIVGASRSGQRLGLEKIISFDMGGTSTDVARFDGAFDYQEYHQVGDAQVHSPCVSIETVAAGGGSVCYFDGHTLRVGPESAGAEPGPACYGKGGPLTITDVNVLLGRIQGQRFEIPISIEASQKRLSELMDQLKKSGVSITQKEVLAGFLSIANELMAGAIKKISVARGYDPSGYTLVSFGGAGGLHACQVASLLGMKEVVVPPDAGILSARGLSEALIERVEKKQILCDLDNSDTLLEKHFDKLRKKVVAQLLADGVDVSDIEHHAQTVTVRIRGQEASFELPYQSCGLLKEEFAKKYFDLYGIELDDQSSLEIELITLISSSSASALSPEIFIDRKNDNEQVLTQPEEGCVNRQSLIVGQSIQGPVVIYEKHGTSFVDEGWEVTCLSDGALAMKQHNFSNSHHKNEQSRSDVVALELFSNRFKHIAQEMGETLRTTTLSTNIKERLDFSCALLDQDGYLLVNAPHIPVHLGALGVCVRQVIKEIDLAPGDVIVTNHPAYGGSHLPDVTVITPVFNKNDFAGFIASRAHHAEIGGKSPGSMPPQATSLLEEGVVIKPTYLVRQGKSCFDEIANQLSRGIYPSRDVSSNMADLRAQMMANQRGQQLLLDLVKTHGVDEITHQMKLIKDYAQKKMMDALGNIKDGVYRAQESLDDGSIISVSITVQGKEACFDFEGTSQTHPGNFNATKAIVNSAVIYVLRVLVGEDLPLNEGLLEAISIEIPTGMLNPEFSKDPKNSPAVVGGNVETCQRLVDTLLKALNLSACSQGTMNNVVFGNHKFSYYETLCGGCGATRSHDGADAVHSHMTNTRITDVEILERLYPVRLDQYQINRGTGGLGAHRGGDGIIRQITFLEAVELSILAQHRREKPFGLKRGQEGAQGKDWIVRGNGEKEKIKLGRCVSVLPGESLIVETPGGGGWGMAPEI